MELIDYSQCNEKGCNLLWIRWKVKAIPNNINEPEKTGIKIKTGDAFRLTPSNTNAPAGGWNN